MIYKLKLFYRLRATKRYRNVDANIYVLVVFRRSENLSSVARSLEGGRKERSVRLHDKDRSSIFALKPIDVD